MQTTLSQLNFSIGNLQKAEELAINAVTTLGNAHAVAVLPSRLDVLVACRRETISMDWVSNVICPSRLRQSHWRRTKEQS
jgi:hypothetical protein